MSALHILVTSFLSSFTALIATGALTLCASPLFAQSKVDAVQGYPSKPIRFIVPFPPGGPMDLTARSLNTRLSERLGQPVVVDYRPGANGNIGTEIAARAAPDGYTILLASPSFAINPSLYRLSFDAPKDFKGISQVTAGYYLLVAHPSLPAKSPAELVNLARSRPGAITFGTWGSGSQSHLAGELLKQTTGIELTHVPYKGSAPAMTDLIAGQISIMFDVVGTALPYVKSGRIRALANASSKRSPLVPDLPTVAETFPAVWVDGWQGIFIPAATPASIVERLQREIAGVLALPETKQRFAEIGFDMIGSTPDAFDRFMRVEYARYAKLIKAANIRID